MIGVLIATYLLSSSSALACREGYGSYWTRPESFIVKKSKWISVVKIERRDFSENKNTYHFSVIRNLKGKGPLANEMKIGPFPFTGHQAAREDIIWRNKGCMRHVLLESGKEYILFSSWDNFKGIQSLTSKNEFRIVKEIASEKGPN